MRLALSADSSWNRWHPSYDELGRRCSSLAIDALELVYYPENDGFDTAPETLASYGVDIVCVNATAKLRLMTSPDPGPAQENILRCVDLAADHGAEFVVLYPGHVARQKPKERLEVFRRRIEPCVERALERGVTLLLENHFDLRGEDPHYTDVVRDPELTAVFLDALGAPNVRVNFDAGNLYAAGIEPWPYAYRLLRDYISYAHLKDMAFYTELLHGPLEENETLSDSKTGTFVPVAVGDGGINYAGLVREMAEDGTARFLTFEDHSLEARADEIYRRGVDYVRRVLA
ncbi:sugar phosphate isomerase/epimerase family protein [Microbacterium ulmi]|uniref:TIM barrel protein n=1 Tax=Microbacterium ulmi TaxID=179095 RepID=A0A7Y2M1Y2_9MICO|nr:sugar phosphate isomerase/epimerase family protein [Microbacterium ulmi]NII69688.1 sugar phosphate isomerase/epimerase [Microbacterium ulmi]NNH05011.1 TIM barrel protein [Microbacterium ulmi]